MAKARVRKGAKKAPPLKSKVGLREIASAAKVSIATASRVLNGNTRVDQEIRSAVWKQAEKLGVDPAQRNRNKTLAFLLSNRAMLHEFHSRILSGAEAQCAANGWDVLYLSFNYPLQAPWTELHLPKVVQRHDLVRAVILAGTNSIELLKLLDQRNIFAVVFGNNVIGGEDLKRHDAVFVDDVHGGFEATQSLINLGHRHIWFVGNTRLPWFARCFQGYKTAMQAAGLDPRQSGIDSAEDAESGYLGAKSLLVRDEPVTAILAGNDSTAHGVYKAALEAGLQIPDDLSVIGCDDTVSILLTPALSTTREFPEQIGKQLVDLALSRIMNPAQGPQSVTIPTEFIHRGSSAAPGRAGLAAVKNGPKHGRITGQSVPGGKSGG
jgi:DNA-binding LacI/PurR family transcriptional regulator